MNRIPKILWIPYFILKDPRVSFPPHNPNYSYAHSLPRMRTPMILFSGVLIVFDLCLQENTYEKASDYLSHLCSIFPFVFRLWYCWFYVLSTDMILFSGLINISYYFEVWAYVCSHVGEWVSRHNIFFGIFLLI